MVYYLTQLLIFRGGVGGVGVKLVSCTVFHSKKLKILNRFGNYNFDLKFTYWCKV
jgi:hypothetical protein